VSELVPDEVPVPLELLVPLELFAPDVPLFVLLLELGAPMAFVLVDELLLELIPGLLG
jgi:hypothetical protein